ncbi:MAG TPA: glycoside hydrolase family 6 protein [Actinomycetes bacterium]|nr:glycoside hydrolase family 6 protein [Actinomycetes bacterium]
MRKRTLRFALAGILAAAALFVPVAANAAPASDRTLPAGTRFLVPPPNPAAVQQGIDLLRQGRLADAARIAKMVSTPQAVWVTQGTPTQARKEVEQAVALAAAQHAVAVLVAYNIPGRDCGGLSAGGALTTADYKAWIDGFAAGIGLRKAVVILEPDGLGLIPSACNGGAGEPGFTDAARFEEINYAVDALEKRPSSIVYLDATHSAWLNVRDAATRLLQAGVQRAQGFFLNVSNFQFTQNLVQYGSWISKCIARVTATPPNDDCPDQYWNGGPHPAKIADLLGEFTGVALSRYGVWSDDSDVPELNTSGENTRYADTTGTTHFVVDTSRNGLGPWQFPSTYPNDGVAQDWCNPPGRGLGARPAAAPVAGNPLVDADLWIKIPGESDGRCTRGTAGPADPEWGLTDPAAGGWFPQQALQLARLASPSLL